MGSAIATSVVDRLTRGCEENSLTTQLCLWKAQKLRITKFREIGAKYGDNSGCRREKYFLLLDAQTRRSVFNKERALLCSSEISEILGDKICQLLQYTESLI